MKTVLKYISLVIIVIIVSCFCGCKENVDIKTGIDPATEAENYSKSSELTLSEMFDDKIEGNSDNGDDTVVFRRVDNIEKDANVVSESTNKGETYDKASVVSDSDPALNTVIDNNASDTSAVVSEKTEVKDTDDKSNSNKINDQVSTPMINDDAADHINATPVPDTKSTVVSKSNEGINSNVNNGNEQNDQYSSPYVLNKSSKKFHHYYCESVGKMKEKNKVKGYDRNTIISQGYKPCKICNP